MTKPRRKIAPEPKPRFGLKFNVQDGGMQIDFPPGVFAELFVNGALQAEFGLGAKGPEGFQDELRKSRAARAACDMLLRVLPTLLQVEVKPDHVVPAAKKKEALTQGFIAGLWGSYRVVGADPEMGIKGTVTYPEHKLAGPSYERGWRLGTAIYAAIKISETGEDPRSQWG